MFGGLGGRALLEVTHRNHVTVVFQHLDGVLDAFLVEVTGARHFRIGKARHVPAQAVHRGFSSQTGTGARLVERRHQRFVAQHITVAAFARVRLKVFCYFEYMEVLVTIEFLQ